MQKIYDFKNSNWTLIALGGILAIALIYSTGVKIHSQSATPVFIGEEIVTKATAVAQPIAETKVVEVPAPLPTPATPLPLIPPAISFKVLPIYPATCLENRVTGTVILSAYVGLTGLPEKVETKLSSGNKDLDDATVKAVSQWRFSPAMQGGVALASWYEVPVKFEVK